MVAHRLKKFYEDDWFEERWEAQEFEVESLWKRWRIIFFVRYFELWNKIGLNEELFFRALKCHRYSLRHFFHGVIGGLHGRQVIKRVGDRWHAVNLAAIYPDIKRLPPEGIAAAREFARKRQAAQK